jgi:hypothetical protein
MTGIERNHVMSVLQFNQSLSVDAAPTCLLLDPPLPPPPSFGSFSAIFIIPLPASRPQILLLRRLFIILPLACLFSISHCL